MHVSLVATLCQVPSSSLSALSTRAAAPTNDWAGRKSRWRLGPPAVPMSGAVRRGCVGVSRLGVCTGLDPGARSERSRMVNCLTGR